MKKFCSLLLTASATLAVLTGCAGHGAQQVVQANRSEVAVRYQPVYIVPNCQNVGGKAYCQWLEPRGHQQMNPAPAAAQSPRVPGIAL